MPYPLPTLSAEVRDALQSRRPLVALESTVITHGLPWPQNLELARTLEATVRAGGACPATVAVLQGEVKVGLSDAELEHLAQAQGVIKVSRRDYGVAVAQKRDGGTTVAGTMIAAQWAGIRVFATGGIGGVHRQLGSAPLDVSADLPELARTPVIVVCAGAKAILDLPATLEWLETHGVPVIGYGTDRFPAFWSRDSGLPVDARYDDPAEIALVMKAQWDLGLEGGLVIGNPIATRYELPRERIETAVQDALAQAAAEGVTGKAITPFLLGRMNELTAGQSLDSNVELVRGNARLAARIAVAYAAA